MSDLSKIDIHELLPQKEPFVMVGRLVHFDMERTVTETEIQADNLFVEQGLFSRCGMIENVAQTCAARIGYVNKYIYKRNIQLGFIGAIRKMAFNREPKVGETIRTEIITLEEVFGMTFIDAIVTAGDEELCRCQMKIALSPIESEG